MAKRIGNPFDPENLSHGGGLWDGKVVTILTAKAMLDHMTYGDGRPVISERDGNPIIKNVIAITGIADEEEAERRETYSVGQLVPTADGESFTDPKTGEVAPFNNKSEAGKLTQYLKDSGFDIGLLWDDDAQKMKVSGLVGAQFLFGGEAQKDKDGKVKVNKKGYEQQKFYPIEFKGFKAGVGKSAPQTNASELRDKAVEVVLEIIDEAGGKIGRADLVRKISSKMAGDARANKVLALVTRDDFHKDVPWTRDATGFSL